MKEPVMKFEDGTVLPYSGAPDRELRGAMAASAAQFDTDEDGRPPDIDFRKRYAGIILQERTR